MMAAVERAQRLVCLPLPHPCTAFSPHAFSSVTRFCFVVIHLIVVALTHSVMRCYIGGTKAWAALRRPRRSRRRGRRRVHRHCDYPASGDPLSFPDTRGRGRGGGRGRGALELSGLAARERYVSLGALSAVTQDFLTRLRGVCLRTVVLTQQLACALYE